MMSNKAADVLITPFAINPQPDESSFDLFNLPLSSLEQYLKVNLLSLFSVCREFAKISENNSSIINFSSTSGIRSPTGMGPPPGMPAGQTEGAARRGSRRRGGDDVRRAGRGARRCLEA